MNWKASFAPSGCVALRKPWPLWAYESLFIKREIIILMWQHNPHSKKGKKHMEQKEGDLVPSCLWIVTHTSSPIHYSLWLKNPRYMWGPEWKVEDLDILCLMPVVKWTLWPLVKVDQKELEISLWVGTTVAGIHPHWAAAKMKWNNKCDNIL